MKLRIKLLFAFLLLCIILFGARIILNRQHFLQCENLQYFSTPNKININFEVSDNREYESIESLKNILPIKDLFKLVDSQQELDQILKDYDYEIISRIEKPNLTFLVVQKNNDKFINLLISYDSNQKIQYIAFQPEINVEVESLKTEIEIPTEIFSWIKVNGANSFFYKYTNSNLMIFTVENEVTIKYIIYGDIEDVKTISKDIYKWLEDNYCE